MIINLKNDNDMLWILNMDNVNIIFPYHRGGYIIIFNDKTEKEISFKEYDQIVKALENK
jgi:hypothetical protein